MFHVYQKRHTNVETVLISLEQERTEMRANLLGLVGVGTVYRLHPPQPYTRTYSTSSYVRLSYLNLPQPTWANTTTFNPLFSILPMSFLYGPPRPLPLILLISTKTQYANKSAVTTVSKRFRHKKYSTDILV
jgi:hypothetical protein